MAKGCRRGDMRSGGVARIGGCHCQDGGNWLKVSTSWSNEMSVLLLGGDAIGGFKKPT